MNFFTELTKRWKLESPVFFKKLGGFGIALTAFCLALLGAGEIAPGITLPNWISEIATHGTVAGFIIKTVASAAIKNPQQL